MKITKNTKGLVGSVDCVDTELFNKLKTDKADLLKLIDQVLTMVHDGDVISGPQLEDFGQEAEHIRNRV